MDINNLARQVWTNHVILETMNEQIDDHQTLYNLCLVNKYYCEIFVKGLYRHISVNDNNYQYFGSDDKFNKLVESGRPVYTKRLSLPKIISHDLYSCMHYNDSEDDRFPTEQLNDCLSKMIQNMPNLKEYGPCQFEHGAQILTRLSKLPHLRSLSLDFVDYDEPNYRGYHEKDVDSRIFTETGPAHWLDEAIYLVHFHNLEELSLASFGRNVLVHYWQVALLHVLKNSPNMHTLRLSASYTPPESIGILPGWEEEEHVDPYMNIMKWICKEYLRETETPLRLRKLILDGAIAYPKQAEAEGTIVINEYAEILEKSVSPKWVMLR